MPKLLFPEYPSLCNSGLGYGHNGSFYKFEDAKGA